MLNKFRKIKLDEPNCKDLLQRKYYSHGNYEYGILSGYYEYEKVLSKTKLYLPVYSSEILITDGEKYFDLRSDIILNNGENFGFIHHIGKYYSFTRKYIEYLLVQNSSPIKPYYNYHIKISSDYYEYLKNNEYPLFTLCKTLKEEG